jgi:hypothetical protein
MAGSCSERERAHIETEILMLRRKRRSYASAERGVPNFRQSACGAVRGRRGGHAKDGQSYQWIMFQWIMLSAASACQRGPAAARSSRRELG